MNRKKINKCADCNTNIDKRGRSKRCLNCSLKIRKGKNHPQYIDGRSKIVCYCLGCNKILSKNAIGNGTKRCISCAQKERLKNPKNNPFYKDGKSLIKAFCIDCKTKLCKRAFSKGNIRCPSCSAKFKFNTTYKYFFIGKKGKDSSFWKGGITPIHISIRTSSNYSAWRTTCFKRDNYMCQECGQRGGSLNVDHIKPFSIILDKFLKKYSQFSPIEDKETLLRLAMKHKPFWDTKNGRTLCVSCHKKTKTYGIKRK